MIYYHCFDSEHHFAVSLFACHGKNMIDYKCFVSDHHFALSFSFLLVFSLHFVHSIFSCYSAHTKYIYHWCWLFVLSSLQQQKSSRAFVFIGPSLIGFKFMATNMVITFVFILLHTHAPTHSHARMHAHTHALTHTLAYKASPGISDWYIPTYTVLCC